MQGDVQGWLMRLKAVISTVQWSVNKVGCLHFKRLDIRIAYTKVQPCKAPKEEGGRLNPYSHTVVWHQLFSRQLLQFRWTHLGKHSKPACHR